MVKYKTIKQQINKYHRSIKHHHLPHHAHANLLNYRLLKDTHFPSNYV